VDKPTVKPIKLKPFNFEIKSTTSKEKQPLKDDDINPIMYDFGYSFIL
jgi:hypothetical protein